MERPEILAVRGRAAARQAASPWEAMKFPHRDADSAARPRARAAQPRRGRCRRLGSQACTPPWSRQARRKTPEETSRELCILRILVQSRRRARSRASHPAKTRGERGLHALATVTSIWPRGADGPRPPTVCVTGTTRVRSRVKGHFHARFCSRGGGSDPLVYCNRTRQTAAAPLTGSVGRPANTSNEGRRGG
jgi:hypothetical protein